MADDAYDGLADVYDWLTPANLLTPEGSVEAFASVVDTLPPGARVLDCAAGTGQLAVGLALWGFHVVAADASTAMVDRVRALATQHDAPLTAHTCTWEQVPDQGWEPFDAVFCVGNSLTHAAGTRARRAALVAMAGLLRTGGVLAITSRNWELARATGSGLDVDDELVVRNGLPGLAIRAWEIAPSWDEPHYLDVAVALIGDDDAVTTHAERLTFWPFTAQQLDSDLRAAGLAPATTTYAPDAERYLVTAEMRPQPGLDHS